MGPSPRIPSALVFLLAFGGCGTDSGDNEATEESEATEHEGPVEVDEASFGCITEMAPIRLYYAANLVGDLDATLAVADDPEGKRFPVGTLIQLVPQEAMVKREVGFSPDTDDWEFFSLKASKEGTEILDRGPEAINAFGGQCLGCHAATSENRDWTCEKGHGCVDLPLTDEGIRGLQEADPRCGG